MKVTRCGMNSEKWHHDSSRSAFRRSWGGSVSVNRPGVNVEVLFFLKERTKFIRRFYEGAGERFRTTIRKIEAEEVPFDDPPYSEDSEPAFMEEWMEAITSLEMLGRTCVSMLSASLQLYFKTWEQELRVEWEPGERKAAFKNGFVQGYRKYFGSVLNLSWGDCPVDFDILEDMVLARNSDQHPDQITTMRVALVRQERSDERPPFFVNESERKMFFDPDMASNSWMRPSLHVSHDRLAIAIEQVEILGEWLEERMFDAKYPARRRQD
ncbi:MAG: hypothetical protein ACRCUE_04530 [Bosea sp. (in: a-proteobacteria)]